MEAVNNFLLRYGELGSVTSGLGWVTKHNRGIYVFNTSTQILKELDTMNCHEKFDPNF